MGRRSTREAAFKLLYSFEVQRDDKEAQYHRFVEENEISGADLLFFNRLMKGVREKVQELDDMIAPTLHKWDISRLPLVDLTILRIGTYELCYAEDVPSAASINECVVLAKKYSNDESRSYINAVLGTIYRQLCPDEEPDENLFDDDDGDEVG